MEYTITHNTKENKFDAIDTKNILLGFVSYEVDDNQFLVVTHTIVEPEYEGQGIAGSLNKEVLVFAKTNNYKVIPACSYTKSYIQRHPEFSSLLIE